MMSELRCASVALDTDHRPCLRQEELDEHSEDDEDEEEDVSQNTPSLHVVAERPGFSGRRRRGRRRGRGDGRAATATKTV